MLDLILLRHAKSDWDADYDRDRDRPLSRRGIQSARAVGEFLAKAGRIPDIALTSPAVRAHHTLELAVVGGQWATDIEVVPELYSGGPGELLEAVKSVDGVTRVLVVSHEPTISSTVSRLLGGGSFRVPTAALVEFTLAHHDWSGIRWGSGELSSFTLARTLLKMGYGNDPNG